MAWYNSLLNPFFIRVPILFNTSKEHTMKQSLTGILLLVTLITFSACSNVGTNFDTSMVKQIQKGKTTQADIENMFGQPYKTGVQNGHPAWVYEFDQYRAFGDDASKDLLIVFNDNKTVRTHQIMSTGSLSDDSGSGSGSSRGGAGGSSDHSGSSKGAGLNNYNCGNCNTTYKK